MVKAKVIESIATQLQREITISVADDALRLIEEAYRKETQPFAKDGFKAILNNLEIANKKKKPFCQSPGTTVAYITLGNKIKIEGNIYEAIREAVRTVTREGYIRPSAVHPISRANTGDNTGKYYPDVEIDLEPDADYMNIIMHMRGGEDSFGTVLKLFVPADVGPNAEGIKTFVLEATLKASYSNCPPFGVGIGIGGSSQVAARLCRKCLATQSWDKRSEEPEIAEFEKEMLSLINGLKIGPNALIGDTTALTVKAEFAHTHAATLPVAVAFHCWGLRRAGARIYEDGSFERLKL